MFQETMPEMLKMMKIKFFLRLMMIIDAFEQARCI